MRVVKRVLLGVLILISVLVVTFYAGPKAKFEQVTPDLPELDISLSQLDSYLENKESLIPNIKPENESRIIWADNIRQTEYALVYLHGFSAGPMEGAPLHTDVARRYGMNIYLPRLSKHGIADKEIFTELTPVQLMNDAKEALVIGRKLGKKVILMSCSTGSTLGIYLTAYYPDIFAHIMYSANIALFNPAAEKLSGPWGLQIARKVIGEYKVPDARKIPISDSIQSKLSQYWSGTYRVEGLIALQSLIDQTMTEEVFERVNQPYFMGYYFKNDTAQDMTVSVKAMLEFDKLTKTPQEKKRVIAFQNAGTHVINSQLNSKEFENVRAETFRYFEEVLDIQVINSY